MATETFNYTGGQQTYTVPSGVNAVRIRCWGAGSGSNAGSSDGADGGYSEGTLAVNPGDTLYVYVGGAGDYGSSGWPDGGAPPSSEVGGGGGSSDVRYGGNARGDRVIVAGGAGGARSTGAKNDFSLSPGQGGGLTGESSGDDFRNAVAEGGTQTSGGSGGGGGGSGSFSSGGAGNENSEGIGSGAGGGWYGGGGGGGTTDDNGNTGAINGAGGSGYIDGVSDASTNRGGGNRGDGYIEIETLSPPSAPASASQTIVSAEEIEVTWDDVDREANYRLEVSEDGGSYTEVASPGENVTSYTYTATPSVDTHQFRVRAENSAGSSDWTYTGTASTKADPVVLDTGVEDELG
ncbi:glycine-rich protein, partial [Haloparvum sedimenti]|uniref:glycine-rich protein n=1 Tax=Haloparvum sedimenti TaxID=1678448 RepID=UPI000A548A7C